MNPLEFHVLLALAARPLYGYAIRDGIAADSGGTLDPRAGSLYRVIARLIGAGLVRETNSADDAEPHPGLERRYYALTAAGRRTLAAEASRLKRAARTAERRLGVAQGRP
jgi:DNA-binding PadR family transcriptional regulator